MQYAISAATVLLFAVARLLLRPKIKPAYFSPLDGEAFEVALKNKLNSLPLPKKGTTLEFSRYKFIIRFSLHMLSRKKYGGIFDCITQYKEDILKALKLKPNELGKLPSIDGEARVHKIARFILQASGFKFDKQKTARVLEAQNLRRTLCFGEIEALPTAFCYAAVERLAHIFIQLGAFAKAYSAAADCVYTGERARYDWQKESRLFLSLCASAASYRGDITAVAKEKLNYFAEEIALALKIQSECENFDFSRFYTPLEILDSYDAFSLADADAKRNFLNMITTLSDKENLDEYLYTVRLDKYMQTASAGHNVVKRWGIMGNIFVLSRQKQDISLLGMALSSNYYMDLYFKPIEGVKHKNKSILKNKLNENTFEPIYKFRTLNFGIASTGGRLKLCPHLPDDVTSADVKFMCEGVEHSLHLKRGEKQKLSVCGMTMTGTDEIRMNGKPLDISMTIADGKDRS